MSRLFALAGLLGLAAPLFAAPTLPKVPPGFQVELVLEAPAIEAPTALCVASNGDVYFAEDPMDMSGPPTKPLDRIWLLKGGDPKKKVLFADKMWAVMGLEIARDKLYVVHAPHVTVFTLDAEGKAKKREELFDDLGPSVAGVPSFNDHIPSRHPHGHGRLALRLDRRQGHPEDGAQGEGRAVPFTSPRDVGGTRRRAIISAWRAAASFASGPTAPVSKSSPAARAIISTCQWMNTTAYLCATTPTTAAAGGHG